MKDKIVLSLPPSLLTASTNASWSSGVQRILGLEWDPLFPQEDGVGVSGMQASPDDAGIACICIEFVDDPPTWYAI